MSRCLQTLEAVETGAALSALDFACGAGRHSALLLACGYRVTALDKDASALAKVPEQALRVQADAEQGPWPLQGQTFDLVLVTHYLWRPTWDALMNCIAPGGVLVYETFMQGNERFGSPRRADFLLQPDELLQRTVNQCRVLAFEQGVRAGEPPAVVQRICAQKHGPPRLQWQVKP